MTNGVDSDQLASEKPTDLDLHCLLRQGMSCLAREGLSGTRFTQFEANGLADKLDFSVTSQMLRKNWSRR